MWTRQHLVTILPCMAIYIVIAFVLAHFLKNKSEKVRLIPTMIIGSLLLLLELGKQIYSFSIGYSRWMIPFHFCSQFFWMIPLMAFYRGKYKFMVRSVATTASMMLLLFLLLYPNSIYSSSAIDNYFVNFISFQSVTFHNLVILNLCIVLALNINEFKTKRDVVANIITFSVYCMVAGVMAQVLTTNYNNFYRNMVDWVESFRLNLINSYGDYGQAIYVTLFSILIVIGSILSYIVIRLLNRLINGKKKTQS